MSKEDKRQIIIDALEAYGYDLAEAQGILESVTGIADSVEIVDGQYYITIDGKTIEPCIIMAHEGK